MHEDDSLSNIVAVWNDGIVLFEWKGNFIMTTIEIYFGQIIILIILPELD